MKKICLIVGLVLALHAFLFADSFFEYSIGFDFFSISDTYNEVGSPKTYSYSIRGKGLTGNANMSFWDSNSSFGVDIGFSFLYPLKYSEDDIECDVGFRDAERGFRIGAIHRYMIKESLILLSSFGYQILMNFDNYYSEDAFVRRTLLKHGLYVQERIVYSISNSISIDAGILLISPFFGSDNYSPKGFDAVKYSDKYTGLIISPYFGIGLMY